MDVSPQGPMGMAVGRSELRNDTGDPNLDYDI